jgi:Winged helix DNA-binding domain
MTVLSLRALNRATLERQWLLERRPATALQAIHHLVGMQSQAPLAPYTGLWTRLVDFDPSELVQLMYARTAVRLSLMRSTIHLATADDALGIYPLLREVHQRNLLSNQIIAPLRETIDLEALASAGRKLLTASALSGSELGKALALEFPSHEPAALSRAVRDLLAGVQVPPRGIWGKGGQPVTTTAEAWLGRPHKAHSIDSLVLRYLGAFGPASVMDMQQWSGLTRLGEVFERLRPQLRTYVSERNGRELFDLESIELPDPDTPAPVRFLAEFDNLMIGYADRTRILSEEHRRQVFTINGIVKGTVLYDGFVVATWKATATRRAARLAIQPLQPLPRAARTSILAEGNKLLQFLAADSESQDFEIAAL